MPENHEHSRYIYNSYYYDGHRLDVSDLDLKAYIDERIAASPGGSSYLVYSANFFQSDTSNPSPIEFSNTIDDTATWVRDAEGFYSCTTNLDYPGTNKIYCPGFTDDSTAQSKIQVGAIDGYWTFFYGNNGGKLYMQLSTEDNTNTPIEFSSLFGNATPLSLPEVRIYP